MITLTNAGYWTLIGLSAIFEYMLHGIIESIKDGTFFDWGDEDETHMHERK